MDDLKACKTTGIFAEVDRLKQAMAGLTKQGLSVSLAFWKLGDDAPFLAASGPATTNPFASPPPLTSADPSTTIFSAASISKLFIGVAILQCVERGEMSLDGDISDYLPQPFRNPRFPDEPITPRMLLCHTSSLGDSERALEDFPGNAFRADLKKKGDKCTMSLEQYLAHPKSPCKTFSLFPPGVEQHYSNAGFTILGLAIQTVTKTSLHTILKERVFKPLELNHTCFCMEDFQSLDPAGSIAVPIYDGGPCLYEVAEWPAAQLRSSAADLIKFLISFLSPTSSPILTYESITTMLPPSRDLGLAWWGSKFPWNSKRGAWEHGGFMEGIRSHAYLFEDRAVVLLVNGSRDYSSLTNILCPK